MRRRSFYRALWPFKLRFGSNEVALYLVYDSEIVVGLDVLMGKFDGGFEFNLGPVRVTSVQK